MPGAKLVAVQLETCHANNDATAWYAYYDGPAGDFDRTAIERAAEKDGAPLNCDFDNDPEEAPNALSRHAGLRRYWVASAV